MAKMEEVFLPYMQDRQGVTFFERMENKIFYSKAEKVNLHKGIAKAPLCN
jgi:hypothetical protein